MIENPNVICNDCAYCKQNKELTERLKKTQELELEVRRENTQLCKKIDKLYADVDYLKKRIDNLLGGDNDRD